MTRCRPPTSTVGSHGDRSSARCQPSVAPQEVSTCAFDGGGEVPPHEITENLTLGIGVLVVGVETEPRFGGQSTEVLLGDPAPFLLDASLVPAGTNTGEDDLHHDAAEEGQRDPSVDGEKEQADDHGPQGQPPEAAEGRGTGPRREDEWFSPCRQGGAAPSVGDGRFNGSVAVAAPAPDRVERRTAIRAPHSRRHVRPFLHLSVQLCHCRLDWCHLSGRQ